MKETYDVWHPDPWPAFAASEGELVDSYDSDSDVEVGWEEYDITKVVKDSLGTERNMVSFILRLRDETPSYNRLISYNSDGDNSQPFDSTKVSADALAKFPYVKVVYEGGISIITKIKSPVVTDFSSVKIYNTNGRFMGSFPLNERASLNKVMSTLSRGVYVLHLKHAEGVVVQRHFSSGR